eukprot:753865-Hanusia_phi.AAC.3
MGGGTTEASCAPGRHRRSRRRMSGVGPAEDERRLRGVVAERNRFDGSKFGNRSVHVAANPCKEIVAVGYARALPPASADASCADVWKGGDAPAPADVRFRSLPTAYIAFLGVVTCNCNCDDSASWLAPPPCLLLVSSSSPPCLPSSLMKWRPLGPGPPPLLHTLPSLSLSCRGLERDYTLEDFALASGGSTSNIRRQR